MQKSHIAILGATLALALAGGLYYWQLRAAEQAAAKRAEMLEEGIGRFERQEYADSLSLLEAVYRAESEDWRVPYYIGSAHMMLKDYELATTWLERALALNNRETGILYALGVAYYKRGKLSLAKAYFGSVLEINPADEHAKGLMDIMAGLEQRQGGKGAEQSGVGDTPGEHGH